LSNSIKRSEYDSFRIIDVSNYMDYDLEVENIKKGVNMNGHWCCGEEMEIGDVTSDGYDVYICNLCGREE
jgi:hypothetical protein